MVNGLGAALMVYLIWMRGWPVLLFALAGLLISVFYVAPPIRLKHIGLGELGVLLVWGPLMIGGVYYVAAGDLPAWVWGASLPYALLTTTVLIGKHVDKHDQDKARGIRTLPVLLGPGISRALNVSLMVLFYGLVVGLVLLRWASPWILISFLVLGRLVRVIRIYREPNPAQPPPDYPVWPLWYVSAAFWHNKLAGALFVAGADCAARPAAAVLGALADQCGEWKRLGAVPFGTAPLCSGDNVSAGNPDSTLAQSMQSDGRCREASSERGDPCACRTCAETRKAGYALFQIGSESYSPLKSGVRFSRKALTPSR
ncbi:MAG: prenyltransferase [Chloroflexi bacterium]|nr:prenyltransferase [Chloroflexota bacterium]